MKEEIKNFKGYKVNSCGHVIETEKPNLDVFKIMCKETSGHVSNIVSERKDDIELAFYQNPNNIGNFGAEIIYYKKNSWKHIYSRNYDRLANFPKKYVKWIDNLCERYEKIFGELL